MIKPIILNLMGPTACGKTDIAIALAGQHPINIISVDSALIYRDMNIGTAKPSSTLRQTIPHYLIDIIEPDAIYSAGHFVQDAIKAIHISLAEKRIPVLVGGTMMYFKALYQGLAKLPPADPSIRTYISELITRWGCPHCYAILKQVDPIGADHIHPNDPQRIQRALEIYYMTGKPLSYFWSQTQSALPSHLRYITVALYPENRSWLHQRIAERFDQMLADGLVDEVSQLMQQPRLHAELPSMRTVGYRQVWQYLRGAFNDEVMRDKAIAATRQLAKRQLTWLKSWPNVDHWFDPMIDQQIDKALERFLLT